MFDARSNRRDFLKTSAGMLAAGATLPAWLGDLTYGAQNPNAAAGDRPLVGSIGVGGQGTGIMFRALEFGDVVAVADVERNHADRARSEVEKARNDLKVEVHDDYRKLLDRKDISIVTIGTPDHWHTKIVIDAMNAGKDVYCEKPLTLTIAEGQQILKTVEKTKRILQVGTQQRSEFQNEQGVLFLRAVATVRSGQLGKIRKVTVSLPLSTEEGGPFAAQPVPGSLNWDFWLGQAPKVDYCPQRCHFVFRWWYEYSGGVVTDWGAHHMDVAQWGLDVDRSGPLTIDGSKTVMPKIENGYNTPKYPSIVYTYPDDIVVELTAGDEFVLFEGEQGRIKVNRGRLTGKPIEDQDQDKSLQDLTNEWMVKLYGGGKPGNHMRNFFESVKSRALPISNIFTQHRSVSACHLGNISARLGRKLTWDAKAEKFVGDDEADKMLSRAQREPYQVIA
jgi:predicted dehydrogenase